jgi:hypothetical protein
MHKHWEEFLACFSDVLGHVGTYVLPHHGSEKNHSPNFIHAVPGRLAIICARRKSEHHPATSVLDYLHKVGDVAKLVDEYCSHGLVESIRLHKYRVGAPY